jgi:hypothetical protein
VTPGCAEVGFRVIVGGSTVNWAEAASPPGCPVAVIVYDPAGTLPTTNEAVRLPPEIEQV